ncbi:MAG: SDR family oxidoreductase [Myxococcota bacterium]
MTAIRPKIIVFGGSGFLGREICRISRSMGHRIISVSRHGRPGSEERWVQGVDWIEADVLEPDTWSHLLEGTEAIIDCIGEAAADSSDVREDATARPARLIAEHAEDAGCDAVVYISCASAPPGVSASRREDRRRAEAIFDRRAYSSSILRPSLISGGDSSGDSGGNRPESIARGAMVDLIADTPHPEEWLRDRQPLRREIVAICALRAALEADIDGILEIEDIAHLGDAMFIQ